jgi:hypothetical protein
LKRIFGLEILKHGSEKGNTRKYTEKWVTSWRIMFLEEFDVFTLIYEEIYFGGIKISGFFGFCSWVHVGLVRRGATVCIWGELFVLIGL